MYKVSNFEKSSQHMYIIQKILSIILYIIIIPIIIFNFTLLVKSLINPNVTPDFLGLKSYVIISKSMEPTIMTGDAIFSKNVKQKDLKINDIISFQDNGSVNTHRIIDITNDNGIIKYTTKGDNNRKEDSEKVTFERIEGKYIFKIDGFGSFINILKNKMTLVILLLLLILVSMYQINLSKRKLLRKEKRYEYNKNRLK